MRYKCGTPAVLYNDQEAARITAAVSMFNCIRYQEARRKFTFVSHRPDISDTIKWRRLRR
jgi:hypothetical protein